MGDTWGRFMWPFGNFFCHGNFVRYVTIGWFICLHMHNAILSSVCEQNKSAGNICQVIVAWKSRLKASNFSIKHCDLKCTLELKTCSLFTLWRREKNTLIFNVATVLTFQRLIVLGRFAKTTCTIQTFFFFRILPSTCRPSSGQCCTPRKLTWSDVNSFQCVRPVNASWLGN